MSEPSHCVVLFDGVCNFCDQFVQMVIPRDPKKRCYFIASQSEAGQEIMSRFGIAVGAVESSIHVIADGEVLTKSAAVIAILRRLAFPWCMGGWAGIVPAFLRDPLYRYFAKNRYRWFGKRDACRLPTPEERSRFIEERAEIERLLG